MTDIYNPQGNDEDPAVQPQTQSADNRSRWHNRTATLADGRRVIWQEPPSGRGGRFVEMSPATADAASRSALENEREMLNKLRETSTYAADFIEHNRERGTGGFGEDSLFPRWGQPHRQAMEGLSAQMVRSNIRPGQATTMNSNAEQMMAMRTYPTPEAHGDVNAERAVRVLVNRDVQIELVRRMEAWLSQHPSINGFQEEWRRVEPELRRAVTARHLQNFGGRGYGFPDLNERGVYSPGAGRREQAPANAGGFELRLDEATGEYHMVRRGR